MRTIILSLFGMVLLQTTAAQQPQNNGWITDLDFLAKELPEKHYDLFATYGEQEFRAQIEAIKAVSERLGNLGTALKTQQLIAKLGDTHTRLSFDRLIDPNQILPVQFLWTSDGIHVLHSTPGNEALLGRRIEAIDGTPIRAVIDSLSTLITVDNQAVVKTLVPKMLPSLQILDYFGIIHGPQVELTLDGGEIYTLSPSADRSRRISFRPDSLAYSTLNERIPFTGRYFPEDKLYYMLYNACTSREIEEEFGRPERAAKLPSFREFEQGVFAALEANPVGKFIVDLRFNGGGSSAQGTEFARKIAAYREKHPQMQVYVVLGRNTFSSAILNAMDFKELTDAIFVGEETAGKPNHFGETRGFELPVSKLPVIYSTNYFKRSDEDVPTLAPDEEIEMSFDDFKKGVDPVYEWIRRQ